MRYFSFSFLSFLSLLAFAFFRPTLYLRPQERANSLLRRSLRLKPRGWKSTIAHPAVGGLMTLGSTALHAGRRRLMNDARLQMV
ncbi:MAG: hypothetical protein DI628_05555 [Blastochloris viridis]|uniref:Uncharacterized protein n=1 Tax=Blastochloris viridis TaxID=1079 RepID=A0A6N4RAS6_BLAVI|nr:MAG: hypothetical protein DI628_05555 [Blastochloris viridis]